MTSLEDRHPPVQRLDGLYSIIDKQGNSIKMRLNNAQKAVLQGLHSRNLILKARQLGMSTFCVLYLLDACIHNKYTSAGIVSYSLEHAQHIFKKIIGHALDSLPPGIKRAISIQQQSAREITLGNGSTLRVDTTLRGGSYQYVLVSEYGKTCARSPVKAEEIITGTLQTISPSGCAIIESTGEGLEGYFADMCLQAHQRGNENLSSLDYKLFFFPWYTEPAYRQMSSRHYTPACADILNKTCADTGIELTWPQRYWYADQYSLLGDKIRQEFPSTLTEAFLSNSDAYYFAEGIELAYKDNRVLSTSLYDSMSPVYLSIDIGVNDLTVIIFFQVVHGEIRIIDYHEDNNKGLDHYARYLMQDKKYRYHSIFIPHDSRKRDVLDVNNTYERELKRYFKDTETRVIVLPAHEKQISLSHAKIKMSRCVFASNKVKPLLDHLTKYRKQWSEINGRYIDKPLHDIHSNFADCFMYAMDGVQHLEQLSSLGGALDKHRKVVENRRNIII